MSWSFEGKGENVTQAAGDFLRQLNDNAHIPEKMKASIALAIGNLSAQLPADSVTTMRTHGHISPSGTGNVTVSIN